MKKKIELSNPTKFTYSHTQASHPIYKSVFSNDGPVQLKAHTMQILCFLVKFSAKIFRVVFVQSIYIDQNF